MSSPFRSQHLFSPSNRNSRKNSEIRSPPDTPFSVPGIRGSSPLDYAYDNSRGVRMLDIDDIDHEAIRNDLEMRALSKNPGAFNSSDVDDYDSDSDIYAEVDYLYDNPQEEHKLRKESDKGYQTPCIKEKIRKFETNRKHKDSSSDVSIPSSPSFLNSLSEQLSAEFFKSVTSNKGNSSKTLYDGNSSGSFFNTKDTKQVSVISGNAIKESYWKSLLYNAWRTLIFILFVVYWIISKSFSHLTAFLGVIESFLFISSPNARRTKLPRRLTSLLIFIVLICGYLYIFSSSVTHAHSTNISYIRYAKSFTEKPFFQNNYLATLKETFKAITTNDQLKNICNKFKETESHDTKNALDTSEHKQNKIENIKQSLNENLGFDIESTLPDTILVKKNKSSQLELSLKVYTYLKDKTTWKIFLEHNRKSVQKYMAIGKSRYSKKKFLEGAIVNKEVFMELLLSSLYGHQPRENEHHILPLDEKIEALVQKHYQAVSNTPDFALESRGARVVMALTSETYYALPIFTRIVRRLLLLHDPFTAPQMAIMANANFGECWTMLGNSGHLGIKLSEPLAVHEIALEYPSPELMLDDMSSAPKQFSVYGIEDYRKFPEVRDFLGKFIYDIHEGLSIQTFTVDADKIYTHIFIRFDSNWGNANHTDIYRVRVHGTPARNLQ